MPQFITIHIRQQSPLYHLPPMPLRLAIDHQGRMDTTAYQPPRPVDVRSFGHRYQHIIIGSIFIQRPAVAQPALCHRLQDAWISRGQCAGAEDGEFGGQNSGQD